MKIVEDSPGLRLTLKGEGTTLPSEALWLVLAGAAPLVLLPAWVLWHLATRSFVDVEHVFWALAWVVATVAVLSKIWIAIRRFPALFDVDRAGGQARLGYRALFGGELDQETLDLEKVERVTVERLAPPDAAAARTGSALTIGFHVCPWPGAGVRTSAMTIAVEGLDRSEEVVDFAFRLAAAAGLPHQRVVRNDPRAVEVDLSRTAPSSPALTAATPAATPAATAPVPVPEGPAPDFSSDQAAPAAQAAVAHEIVEPFRPASFESDHELKVWKPGVEVVFHSAWDGLVFVFGLPFLLLPVAWYLWEEHAGTVLYEELLMHTVVAGVIGAVIGIPSIVGLVSAKSRTVRLDWDGRTISIREGSRSQVIPMADLEAVELDCRHETDGGGGGGTGTHSNNVVIHRYHCLVRVHWRDASAQPASATLVETGEADEPDAPYRRTIPLVTELARSLGVERRVTDYGSGSSRHH